MNESEDKSHDGPVFSIETIYEWMRDECYAKWMNDWFLWKAFGHPGCDNIQQALKFMRGTVQKQFRKRIYVNIKNYMVEVGNDSLKCGVSYRGPMPMEVDEDA